MGICPGSSTISFFTDNLNSRTVSTALNWYANNAKLGKEGKTLQEIAVLAFNMIQESVI